MDELQQQQPPDFFSLLQQEWDVVRRRLRGMAMISRGIVPNLLISQRMVDRVVDAARHFLADETGETMVGLVLDAGDLPESMPTIYVLDTIAPDASVVRRSHMFEQGDEAQEDIYYWLRDNWDAYLEIGQDMQGRPIRDEWRSPLKHLGDWHKQPGFMIQPSGGDLMTALRILDDEEQDFEFLLVPIVTLGHDTVTMEDGAIVNYFSIPMDDGTSLRMDWWYIHRDVRIFQPITPRIIKDLPTLTPYPWHILEQELLEDEVALMEEAGLFVIGATTVLWESDGDLPLEICFIVGAAGVNRVLLIVTNWDYPRSSPKARVAEFAGINAQMYIYDIFEQLWERSTPVEPPANWVWTEETTLADFAQAIHGVLGIQVRRPVRPQAETPQAAPRAVNIPVQTDDAPPRSTPAAAKPSTPKATSKPQGAKPSGPKSVQRKKTDHAEDEA
jgi:hypothetical protein